MILRAVVAGACFILSLVVAYEGFQFSRALEDKDAEMTSIKNIEDRYKVYEISDELIEDSNFWNTSRANDTNPRYVFPGNEINYTVSKNATVPFDVEFLPHGDGASATWALDIQESIDPGGPSNYMCNFYRVGPLGQRFPEGKGRCPDKSPSSRLSFKVADNPNLIGKLLTVIIHSPNEVVLAFRVSDYESYKSTHGPPYDELLKAKMSGRTWLSTLTLLGGGVLGLGLMLAAIGVVASDRG